MGFLFPFGRPGLYRIRSCFGGGEEGGLKVTGENWGRAGEGSESYKTLSSRGDTHCKSKSGLLVIFSMDVCPHNNQSVSAP